MGEFLDVKVKTSGQWSLVEIIRISDCRSEADARKRAKALIEASRRFGPVEDSEIVAR